MADLEQRKPILEERSNDWCQNKASIISVDINDPENLRAVVRGGGAVANCTTHHLNLKVMDACLAESVNYVDMGGLFHVAKKQLQLNGRTRGKVLLSIQKSHFTVIKEMLI